MGHNVLVAEEGGEGDGVEEEDVECVAIEEHERMRFLFVPDVARNVLFSVHIRQRTGFRRGHLDMVVPLLQCCCKFEEGKRCAFVGEVVAGEEYALAGRMSADTEVLAVTGEVGVVVGVRMEERCPCATETCPRCALRVGVECTAAACALVVPEDSIGGLDDTESSCDELEAVIDVVVAYGEVALIEATDFPEEVGPCEHARGGHRRVVAQGTV